MSERSRRQPEAGELPALAIQPPGETVQVPPQENPDWGYARTRRSALLAPSAEWVQSVFSCCFESRGLWFIAPNRDYTYEGLLVHQGEEHWKLIDCVGLALRTGRTGDSVLLAPDPDFGVRLTPWCATYAYRATVTDIDGERLGDVPIELSYYLCTETSHRFITGCVELHCPRGLSHAGRSLTVVLQPFLDMRHMYDDPEVVGDLCCEYRKAADERLMTVARAARALTFVLPEGAVNRFDAPAIVSWYYKLGSGSRVECPATGERPSETRFDGKPGRIAAWFNSEVTSIAPGASARLFWCSTLRADREQVRAADVVRCFERSRHADRERHREIEACFPIAAKGDLRVAIHARIAGLTKLKSYVEQSGQESHAQVPPAGCWWFRTPWFRDIFEGLLSNLAVFARHPAEKDTVKNAVLAALAGFDAASGRIANKTWERRDHGRAYNSADATLLCFITAAALLRATKDLDLARRVLRCVMHTVSSFAREEDGGCSTQIDAPPRADPETGLLLSVPSHSWIDTAVRRFDHGAGSVTGLPNRVSERFIQELFDHLVDQAHLSEVLASPNFFLPEINAQWIIMLAGLLDVVALLTTSATISPMNGLGRTEEVRSFEQHVTGLLSRARANFKRVFWNAGNGFLYNCVFLDREVRDVVEGEPAVVAASLLASDVLTLDDARSIWSCVRRSLLVSRRPSGFGGGVPLPFGIAAKNEAPTPFYDDGQYHANVVWPRSTPYLIRLLEVLGEKDVIRDILLNNLDHQMTEGAVFYNHELFSRPLGNNPSPVAATQYNPVPVKNPIQFWSQWCDAFIQYFGTKGLGVGLR